MGWAGVYVHSSILLAKSVFSWPFSVWISLVSAKALTVSPHTANTWGQEMILKGRQMFQTHSWLMCHVVSGCLETMFTELERTDGVKETFKESLRNT